jgi:hypothetical protein
MFIEDCSDIGFGHFRVPGAVRVHHDGWALFAGTETGRTGDQHISGHHAALHDTHVERHQQLAGAMVAAGGFGMTRGTGVGTDDNVIFRFWHANSLAQSSDQPSAISCQLKVKKIVLMLIAGS